MAEKLPVPTKHRVYGLKLPDGINRRSRRLSAIIRLADGGANILTTVTKDNNPLCIADAIYCGYTEYEIMKHVGAKSFSYILSILDEECKKAVVIAKIQRLIDIENVTISEMVKEVTTDIESEDQQEIFKTLSLSKLKMENLEKLLKVTQNALNRYQKAVGLDEEEKQPPPAIIMSESVINRLPKD